MSLESVLIHLQVKGFVRKMDKTLEGSRIPINYAFYCLSARPCTRYFYALSLNEWENDLGVLCMRMPQPPVPVLKGVFLYVSKVYPGFAIKA